MDAEPAGVIRPQAGKGAHQGGFADAAAAVKQQPFGRGGVEIKMVQQGAAFGGVEV